MWYILATYSLATFWQHAALIEALTRYAKLMLGGKRTPSKKYQPTLR
ncbi:hypothetical protein PF004_g28285 [Phytophthora fragariae]|uniref:Uncharacterized protein n=1 Tax=Phytophthora fragariae TaxID=53985 RepID=A0A6G0MIV8_9STRA|nr:hypothetical protein PF004_g28285 [Phytophthora fragariae]